MRHPYREREVSSKKRIRTFDRETDPRDLVWHRDRESRSVRVVEGCGWSLQMDGDLPTPMTKGDVRFIPQGVWHRVLRDEESTDLTLEVLFLDPYESLALALKEAVTYTRER